MKKFITAILSILALIIGFAGGAGYYLFVYDKPQSDVYVSGDLEIHFMELGNIYTGDSIYIRCGDYDILVDAGSRQNSSTAIISYVDQYVEDGKLEYVIATHADQDHIAAFPSTSSREGIFAHYEVGTIIDFPKTNKDTNVYNNYVEARDAEVAAGAKHYTALEYYNSENNGIIELAGGVEIQILYNYYYENNTSDENNYSVCFMINQGDNHYLFTGDLEKEGEEKLVEFYNQQGGLPKCKLYKAGHHGSKTSSSAALMAQIQPEHVVVCCCAGTSEYTSTNENQFPTQEMINNVAPYTDKIYVTTMVDNYVESGWSSSGTVKSMNGNIVFKISGNTIEINCSNNNTILKDTDWFKEYRTWPTAA